ncbi:hypothetical protein GE21DRAFT_1065443 [Neurospora crassa]|nr:hypothetical protein GE21DRAFT_1065443 [Neurospora crassa]
MKERRVQFPRLSMSDVIHHSSVFLDNPFIQSSRSAQVTHVMNCAHAPVLQSNSGTFFFFCSGNPVTFALGLGLGFGIVGNCSYVVVSFFSPSLPVCPTLMMPVM